MGALIDLLTRKETRWLEAEVSTVLPIDTAFRSSSFSLFLGLLSFSLTRTCLVSVCITVYMLLNACSPSLPCFFLLYTPPLSRTTRQLFVRLLEYR